MSVTIKTIAKDLNLAVSTVSKALGDSHEISPETKKRIYEHAKLLDYVPNAYAGSLKKRKTANIAIVIPEVADSFFSLAINGIEAVAQEQGFHVIVYLTHEDQAKEQSILRQLKNGRVDGLLMSVSGGAQKEHIQDILNASLPLVFFDRDCESIHANRVVTNDLDSSFRATELLIKKNCSKIAFLSLSENLSIINQRMEGYELALKTHGIPLRDNYILRCTNNEAANIKLLKELLLSETPPDAIIGSVEKLTMLIYSVCFDLKISIPQKLKVIGFSSLDIASFLNPSLTTVTQPAFEIGKAAAGLLFQMLDNRTGSKKETITIPSVLIERESTSV